jgi:YihY family inner membrane protein
MSAPPLPVQSPGFFHRIGVTAQRIWPAVVDLAGGEVYVLASAIAFNALLSFFPFMILLMIACRALLNWRQGGETLLALLHDAYLPVAQDFIVQVLKDVTEKNTRGGIALLSLGSLIFTSSGLFTPLEIAFNRAWKVTRPRPAWQSQIIAMSLVAVCGALALAATWIAANVQWGFRQAFGATLSDANVRLLALIFIKFLSLPVTIAVFFTLYYVLPSRRPPVMRVLPTAIWVGILWEAAKYLFEWSLPLLNFAKVYGAFYVTVTLVMWAFISALLLLLGANLAALDAEPTA